MANDAHKLLVAKAVSNIINEHLDTEINLLLGDKYPAEMVTVEIQEVHELSTMVRTRSRSQSGMPRYFEVRLSEVL